MTEAVDGRVIRRWRHSTTQESRVIDEIYGQEPDPDEAAAVAIIVRDGSIQIHEFRAEQQP